MNGLINYSTGFEKGLQFESECADPARREMAVAQTVQTHSDVVGLTQHLGIIGKPTKTLPC